MTEQQVFEWMVKPPFLSIHPTLCRTHFRRTLHLPHRQAVPIVFPPKPWPAVWQRTLPTTLTVRQGVRARGGLRQGIYLPARFVSTRNGVVEWSGQMVWSTLTKACARASL